MLLYWNIRCFDRNGHGGEYPFKDRYMFLETESLDATTRAAVEFVAENRSPHSDRDILRFRHLFVECNLDGLEQRLRTSAIMRGVGPEEYFEDETGKEITLHEIGQILTGSPTAMLIPNGAKQHDIDYMLAEPTPIPVAEVSLSPENTRLLGYFVRDLQELRDSALMKDGAGTISSGGTLPALPNGDYHLTTAVTDDEIRSFLTIFRRLYMVKEPANFLKAAGVFAGCLGNHRLGKWVKGAAGEYEAHLQAPPGFPPFTQGTALTFTVKRLIDVFLYTQYAHQPDEKRQRQFTECLQQVGGKRNFLTWLFLTEVWTCGLKIRNVGRVIADWFRRYCDHQKITPDVLNSLRSEHKGLGTEEKQAARRARLFREKVEELEVELWKQAGRPEGGPVQFRLRAQEQLKRVLNGEEMPEWPVK